MSAVAVALVLLVPLGGLGYRWITACRGEERAIFEEFPQYSPRTPQNLDPRPDDLEALSSLGDTCVAVYETPDVASEVLGYFAARLKENDWELRPSNGASLYARKGNYEYRISFPSDPTSTRGTRVTVIVREL